MDTFQHAVWDGLYRSPQGWHEHLWGKKPPLFVIPGSNRYSPCVPQHKSPPNVLGFCHISIFWRRGTEGLIKHFFFFFLTRKWELVAHKWIFVQKVIYLDMKYFQFLEKVLFFFSRFCVCISWLPLSHTFYCYFPHWEKLKEKNSMKKKFCPDLK